MMAEFNLAALFFKGYEWSEQNGAIAVKAISDSCDFCFLYYRTVLLKQIRDCTNLSTTNELLYIYD